MTTTTSDSTSKLPNETTELSEKYDELEGSGPEPYSAFSALKERIKLHYDLASDYYLSLWGEHIHHGYFTAASETKEQAQVALINLLLEISSLQPATTTNTTTSPPLRVLDVGCGLGGTTRHLATNLGAHVTGITISTRQVELAKRLTLQQSTHPENKATNPDGSINIGDKGGRVTFLELDAEKMGECFSSSTPSSTTTSPEPDDPTKFNVVWISEALSHFPNKPLFFTNAFRVLRARGKLVIADWFKAPGLTATQFADDIQPIEHGMLLPPLCTQQDYVDMATRVGFTASNGGCKDISSEVKRTWDITWSLIQSPSLWAFAFSQGRDGVAFLQSFRAMRRGYANGAFRYAVVAFEKA